MIQQSGRERKKRGSSAPWKRISIAPDRALFAVLATDTVLRNALVDTSENVSVTQFSMRRTV